MLSCYSNRETNKRGFTLLELLIVIGIIAILVAVTVVVLDPDEYLKRSRDSQRIADLSVLYAALDSYFTSGVRNFDLDGPTYVTSCADQATPRVFVSIPSDVSMPSNLPSGWGYNQVGSAALYGVNGSGWLPLDLTSIPSGSPLGGLPVDPTNDVNSDLYYSYVCKTSPGAYELNAQLESRRFNVGGGDDKVSKDGGDDPYVYEVGSNLSIIKFEKLANATFETGDLTGWNNWAAGITGATTTVIHWAPYSAIIKNSDSYCNNYYVQDLPVAANTVYTIGAWIKTVNEVGNPGIGICNTSWTECLVFTPYTVNLSGTKDWTYVTASANSGSYTTLRFLLTVQWCGGPPPGSGPSGTTYFAEPSVMAGSTLFNNR